MNRRGTNRREAKTTTTARVRVAVYARKSVDKGDGGEFGSIEAQCEAVSAYVTSQRGNGWEALPDPYSDLGISGATTNRPAFKRLLADIEAGRVDAVATYKLDRLSRTQRDLFNLLDFFDQHDVTFVSVTESFDTATPMGRFALGLLGQVAQLEREVTAERVRDKVMATKRRGMWTGGRPPLGYDVVEKKLVVNVDEAERVREIYGLYLALPGYQAVLDEMERRGWRNKAWTTKTGKLAGGETITKNSLGKLLQHPVYIGKVAVEDELFEGEHVAIIDQALWDAVQAKLTSARNGTTTKARSEALLAGILHCGQCGCAMGRHHTGKGAKRYSYYVCQTVQKRGATACPGSRIRLATIEDAVVAQVRTIGRNPALVTATIQAARDALDERRPTIEAEVRSLGKQLADLETERSNLVVAIGKGADAPTAILERLREVEVYIADVEQRRDEARERLGALTDESVDEDDLVAAIAAFDPVWEHLFPKERQRIVQILLERVTYTANTGEIGLEFSPVGVRTIRQETAEEAA